MNVDSSVKAGMSSAPSNLLEGVDIDEDVLPATVRRLSFFIYAC